MQYYVPQFIESESKIVGPLSLKQFMLIAIPVGIIAILYFIFKTFLIIVMLGILLVGGAALAFLKYQGQDLTSLTLYGFNYFLNPKEYVWTKKEEVSMSLKEIQVTTPKTQEKEANILKKPLEESRLKKLSWNINTTKRF